MGRGLAEDTEQLEVLKGKFARFGMRMADTNLKQAEVIDGARVLPNPRGSAPGQALETDGKSIFLFPGVPRELRGMARSELEPWLEEETQGEAVETRVLRIACVGESTLEERILPAYTEFGREALSVLASAGEIQVRVTATGHSKDRSVALDSMTRRLRQLIGDSVYAEGQGSSLESVVGSLLTGRGKTVVTAESCTGGLIAKRLTAVPGSSGYFLGGVVTYSDRMKCQLLEVPPEVLEEHGAVSPEVVSWMASGARRLLGADYALAVSGIAGPGGGTGSKPVGLVYIGLAGDSEPEVQKHQLLGRSQAGAVDGESVVSRPDAARASTNRGRPRAGSRRSGMERRMRLFVGLEIPRPIRLAMHERTARLRNSLPQASWVASADYHLLLAFLGDTSERRHGQRRSRVVCGIWLARRLRRAARWCWSLAAHAPSSGIVDRC